MLAIVAGFAAVHYGLCFLLTHLLVTRPSWRARRLQKFTPSWAQLRPRLPNIFLNMTLQVTLALAGLWAGAASFVPGRSAAVSALTFVVILVVDDAFFYAWHRLMHASAFLYRKVHRVHHRAYAPVPIDLMYLNPVEYLVGGGGVALGAVIAFHAFAGLDFPGLFAYLVWRDLRELLQHSGLSSPWMMRSRILGTTEHHDLHHARLRGNYASMLRIWDRVFRTELA
jgi:sterol desaturase/sphingolipid hydroxylase (fatty acid hydroxylase superfamily)